MKSNPLELLKGKGASCLVLPHINPDGDTIGASFALSLYLETICERVVVVHDEELPANLQFLKQVAMVPPHVIEQELGSFDWVIAVDSSDMGRLGDRAHLLNMHMKSMNIDHHKTNDLYADFNVVEVGASSTGEIVYDLLVDAGAEITPDIAEALYVALSTDTGSFKYSNTSGKTMATAGKLIDAGIDLNKINTELYQNKPLYKMQILQTAMANMTMHLGGKLVTSWIDIATMEEEGIEVLDTDGVAEYFRDIAGVEVVLFVKEKEPGLFRVSLRSKYDFDVSSLAAVFGGGGHAKAAGCAIVTDHAKDAVDQLVEACRSQWEGA